jgi:DNA-binding transcriptional LysR family regulator
MEHLDLGCLRTFVLTVDLGSLGRAAASVGRSQSAASLQVKRLEAQLGQKLLKRNGRGLVPTPPGAALLGKARSLLELHDETLQLRTGDHISGEVRLGIAQDLADGCLTPALGRFARAHPDVHLLVRSDKTSDLIAATRSADLDLCLVFETPDKPGRGTPVAEVPMVWLGPRDSALHVPTNVPLVVFDGACCFNAAATQALKQARRASRIAFTSANLASQWAAIASGLGIGVRTRIGVPQALRPLTRRDGLPALPNVAIRLHRSRNRRSRAHALVEEALLTEIKRLL